MKDYITLINKTSCLGLNGSVKGWFGSSTRCLGFCVGKMTEDENGRKYRSLGIRGTCHERELVYPERNRLKGRSLRATSRRTSRYNYCCKTHIFRSILPGNHRVRRATTGGRSDRRGRHQRRTRNDIFFLSPHVLLLFNYRTTTFSSRRSLR